jgi:predicted RNA-binding Zn-ribbon protein involved in translation (DUF1610 family)
MTFGCGRAGNTVSYSQETKIVVGGRIMVAGKLSSFNCPNCNALYQVVSVEAGPETVSRDITCRSCGNPLLGRDGNFVLKYFLLRKAGRIQKWKRA